MVVVKRLQIKNSITSWFWIVINSNISGTNYVNRLCYAWLTRYVIESARIDQNCSVPTYGAKIMPLFDEHTSVESNNLLLINTLMINAHFISIFSVLINTYPISMISLMTYDLLQKKTRFSIRLYFFVCNKLQSYDLLIAFYFFWLVKLTFVLNQFCLLIFKLIRPNICHTSKQTCVFLYILPRSNNYELLTWAPTILGIRLSHH